MVYEGGGMWDGWNGGEENKEVERREKYEIINQRLINLLFMRGNMTSRCVKNSILFINYTPMWSLDEYTVSEVVCG